MTPEEMEGVSRFGRAIDGAAGTLVFGNGVPALFGEIAHTGDDDYLVVEGNIVGVAPRIDENDDRVIDTFAVPISSVVYFRWRDDRV